MSDLENGNVYDLVRACFELPLLVVLGLLPHVLVLLTVGMLPLHHRLNITLCTSDHCCCLARMNDKLRMFKHEILSLFVSFPVQYSMDALYTCIHAFIEYFLLQWEAYSHCLYWEWLKVRLVGVPKYTLCVHGCNII